MLSAQLLSFPGVFLPFPGLFFLGIISFPAELPRGCSRGIFFGGFSQRIFPADLPGRSSQRIFPADLLRRFSQRIFPADFFPGQDSLACGILESRLSNSLSRIACSTGRPDSGQYQQESALQIKHGCMEHVHNVWHKDTRDQT